MSVPVSPIDLADVKNELGLSSSATLGDCVSNAESWKFDPDYQSSSDPTSTPYDLLDFRNYGADAIVYYDRYRIGIDEVPLQNNNYIILDYRNITTSNSYTMSDFSGDLYDKNQNIIGSSGTVTTSSTTIYTNDINYLQDFGLNTSVRNILDNNSYTGSYIDYFYWRIDQPKILDDHFLRPRYYSNDIVEIGWSSDNYKYYVTYFYFNVVECLGDNAYDVDESISAPQEGDSYGIEVQAVGSWTVTKVDLGDGTGWFSTNISSGNDNITLIVDIFENSSGQERYGRIKIDTNNTSLYISINQSG